MSKKSRYREPTLKSLRAMCYHCAWRRPLPGVTHSACAHPKAGKQTADPMMKLLAIFASVGRVPPTINIAGTVVLGVKLDEYGVQNGWANWPFNFDPNWLLACKGFMFKEDACKVCSASAVCLPVGRYRFTHKPVTCPWVDAGF
jgi:hypothetical protein